MSQEFSRKLEAEIQTVADHVRAMLAAYQSWGDEIEVGDTQLWLYNEVVDFVNFRMETVDTCLGLIDAGKVADALGLCRPLLEHYLLLMLICRGNKYFQLRDRTDLTEGPFKSFVKEQQEEIAAKQEAGTTQCLTVKKYPRAKRHIMYVFEGLKSDRDDEPGFVIPVHYFHFKEFQPETMRLKRGDYFEYYEPPEDLQKAMEGHRQEATALYRHYLSYDALLTCLELNELVDQPVVKRIEAHYTFLGRFLHPTNDAARDLHERSNYHAGKPAIGMSSPYTGTARLLALLYACYLTAGLLDGIAGLHEHAPKKFIKDPGTKSLRQLASLVPRRYPYFWFLFNEPPLYDKFNYCANHVTKQELDDLGHYSKIPNERVPFDMHIYSHLEQALGGWSNNKCGNYRSPLL